MTVEPKLNDDALSELASEVIVMYPANAEFRAEEVLAANPELAASRRSVIKITFEEYCRRYDNDESIDVNEFVERFPGVASCLQAQINIHSAMLRDPRQFDQWLKPDWPVPDSKFLDWKIRRLIGRGGFSRVYLADEAKVGNRPVALKLTTRTGHECELVGRLNHPGICQILSVRDDGPGGLLTAIAMPYHGEATLQDLIEEVWHGRQTRATDLLPDWGEAQSPTFVDGVVTMAVRLCEALEYAHGQNVLHCDLKPSNVLLRGDGSPILLDFNLAFSTTSGARVLGGTVGYMAPEQFDATLHRDDLQDIDARADVFGLGAVLYHVLSGSPAFAIDDEEHDGDRLISRLANIVVTPPTPLHERHPAVTRPISDLVQRCLSAEPACRPQSIAEVRRILADSIRPAEPTPAPPAATRPGWIQRLRLAAWGTALVAVLGAALALAIPSRPAALDLDQEIDRLESISAADITAAERELLAYYYCLQERWQDAKQTLETLLDESYETASVRHNLAYCSVRASTDEHAYQDFLKALSIDSEQGISWTALTYYDAFFSLNEGRFPYLDYMEEARRHSDDAGMLSLLCEYVEAAAEVKRERDQNEFVLDSPSLQRFQASSVALGALPVSHWLVAPTNLPEIRFSRNVATN